VFDGRIQKFLDTRKGDYLVKATNDFFPRHPHDRAVQKNVFAAGEFVMKTRSHLEQTGHAAA